MTGLCSNPSNSSNTSNQSNPSNPSNLILEKALSDHSMLV